MRSCGELIRSAAPVTLLWCACVVLCGCGDRGPRRYRACGAVTFAGAPVAAGRIVFDPDITRGNSGPQGFAWIRAGRYDTADANCKGTVGGPQIVTIDGIELSDSADPLPSGRPLFPTHEERIDLPTADTTRDFAVPQGSSL